MHWIHKKTSFPLPCFVEHQRYTNTQIVFVSHSPQLFEPSSAILTRFSAMWSTKAECNSGAMAFFRILVVTVRLPGKSFAVFESGNIWSYNGARLPPVKNKILCSTIKLVCNTSAWLCASMTVYIKEERKAILWHSLILNSIRHFTMSFSITVLFNISKFHMSERYIFLAWNYVKRKTIYIDWTYLVRCCPFVLILWIIKFSFFSSVFFSHYQHQVLPSQRSYQV